MSYSKKSRGTYDTIQVTAKIPQRFHDAAFEFHNPLSPEEMEKIQGDVYTSRIVEEAEESDKKHLEEERLREERERQQKIDEEIQKKLADIEAKKLESLQEVDAVFKKALEDARKEGASANIQSELQRTWEKEQFEVRKSEREKERKKFEQSYHGKAYPEAIKKLYVDDHKSVSDIKKVYDVPKWWIYETLANQGIRIRGGEQKDFYKTFTPEQLKKWGYPVPTKEEEKDIQRGSVSDTVKQLFPSGLVGEGRRRKKSDSEERRSSSLWDYELD